MLNGLEAAAVSMTDPEATIVFTVIAVGALIRIFADREVPVIIHISVLFVSGTMAVCSVLASPETVLYWVAAILAGGGTIAAGVLVHWVNNHAEELRARSNG